VGDDQPHDQGHEHDARQGQRVRDIHGRLTPTPVLVKSDSTY
jgi:hypothetical protein